LKFDEKARRRDDCIASGIPPKMGILVQIIMASPWKLQENQRMAIVGNELRW